jgi:uncharacterized membrane protein YgcG
MVVPAALPASVLFAQAPAAPATASTQGPVSLRGSVTDPDDAFVPGAAITLTGGGKSITATSGSDGNYAVRGVPPGTYSMTITMPGFATFVRQGVKISATAPTVLNAKLIVQDAETVVNVTTNQNTVSVDQDANASSTILTGKDLDALSDDPDELQSELSALAGPAAGPNGGQIYIDGFTGGQLPPKSSIREIRINQNPFSAQYDRAGFGRVEIFTKPGTDKFHGNASVQGQDKSFNTGSPYIGSTAQPGYHTIFSNGSITGPINKKASFTVAGSYREIQDNSIVDPPALFATSQTSGIYCLPGTAGCSIYQSASNNGFTFAQFQPQTRWDISPRFDLALAEKNTMTVRISGEHNTTQNQGIGGLDLASTGSNGTQSEITIQATDTQIVSSKIINETRFEFQRTPNNTTPLSTAPTINVQGAFVGGGSSTGLSDDLQHHIEIQNYTSIALAKNFIRVGGRLRTTDETNTTSAGVNGTFTYNSIANYTGLPLGCLTVSAACPQGQSIVSQYSITNITVPTLTERSTDLGLYAEDDWKVRPNFTFSYGLRYETQNYIHDHSDFAPRTSIAWGVSKKTVLRAGAGLFYDRFSLSNEFSVYRNNGTNQRQSIISGNVPSTCGPANPAACPAVATSSFTTRSISSNLRAPYSLQINVGVDQQLFKGATVSVNYQHIRGVHQFNSDVSNFGSLTATTPINYMYQYQSEGVFNQNQLVTNINYRYGRATIFGFYVLNYAKSDTAGAGSFGTNPFNLGQDYGRAAFDTRNRLFLGGNISLPHLVSLSPLLVANSGSPYNITSGTDNNADTIFNDRAVFVPAGTTPITGGYVKTNSCGTFATPGTLGVTTPVPVNYCTGPAGFVFNLRAAKTFGFGGPANPNAARPDRGQQGGGARPPGGSGGPGGPGGGGGPRGGGGGGGFGGGGGASSGKKYNLSFGVQVQNLFNIVDRGTPVGTLSSPSFGTSTALAGGIFTSNSAVRRIYLQTSFNF